MILNSLPLLELYLNLPMQSCLTPIQNMGMTREKYNIKFTQIQVNQKYHHPDDDLEQFAFARTLFQPPNAKLVKIRNMGISLEKYSAGFSQIHVN